MFRDQLRYEWPGRLIADAGEAKNAVHSLARDLQRAIGLPPTVVILEFACGACNALDEYTFFITPGQPTDDPAALSGELAAYGILLNWRDRNLIVERVVPGLALGLLGSYFAGRALESQLFEVPATDALHFTLAAALLGAIAFLACLLPAQKATRIDPATTLRTP